MLEIQDLQSGPGACQSPGKDVIEHRVLGGSSQLGNLEGEQPYFGDLYTNHGY